MKWNDKKARGPGQVTKVTWTIVIEDFVDGQACYFYNDTELKANFPSSLIK